MRNNICVVIPYRGESLDDLREAADSVASESVETVILNASKRPDAELEIAGTVVVPCGDVGQRLFARVLETWLISGAFYLTWMSPLCVSSVDRLKKQADRLRRSPPVSAVYTDVIYLNADSAPVTYAETKPFSPDMLGLECFAAETTLICKRKFEDAGGFDHALAACYKPRIFVPAICALAGPLERVPGAHVEIKVGEQLFQSPRASSSAHSPEKDLWERIRFETFILRAREHLKTSSVGV